MDRCPARSDRSSILKLTPFAFRHVPEGALHRLAHFVEADFADIERDRARLDLRQVENVVDQLQQIFAGAADGAGKLDLFRRQVAVRVRRKLIGENEQAVERRAQLVGHVREELGLVARGERELLRLAFQRLPRLLDLAVLAFDFFVLLEELPRLFLQLLVGLLQFLLPALQLGREGLRLFQQIFRARVRFDRVQDDADAFRELIEKRLVGRVELIERGKLHDRFDLALEQDRQDDDVHRRALRPDPELICT